MNAEFYSQTALYGHPLTTDSLLCPWGKGNNKALTYSLNSTLLIRTISMVPSVCVLKGGLNLS